MDATNKLLDFGKKLNYIRFNFILRGVLVGIVAGFIVSLFRLAIEALLEGMKKLFGQLPSTPSLWSIVIVFFLIVIFVNAKFLKKVPHISGSGIPQVEGQLLGMLELKWWPVLWRKWLGGVLAIGSGLFLGREGPSIQLGAAAGQGLAEHFKLDQTARRCLIAGGAAAGLSAAFNAPIAASLFIVEEVYHNFSPYIWTTALSAAVTANFVAFNFFGLTPVLHMQQKITFPIAAYGHLIVLGVVLGFLGLLYEYLTLNCSKFYQRLSFLQPRFYSVIPLLCLPLIGIFWPIALGGGNGLIVALPTLDLTTKALCFLFILRLLFSTLSYGSTLPGGIFLPILTLGALIGALYFKVAHASGLLADGLMINCIIYAMAGYFACIGKAPFTAILLVTEMVGTLEHLMPLALVSLTAYTVCDIFHGRPIYEAMLAKMTNEPKILALRSGQQDRFEYPIFAGSKLQDRAVKDIAWPKDCLILALRRGETEYIVHGDSVMKAGDTLVILTTQSARMRINEELTRLSALGEN